MVAQTSVDIGKLISKSAEVYHGLPVVAGTQVTVMGIVDLLNEGLTPGEIAAEKWLTLAQVHAALAYYYANQKEVDGAIAEERAEYEAVSRQEAVPGEKDEVAHGGPHAGA